MLLSFVFVQYPVIYTKFLCETKDFVFLQNQVIYTNLLIWTKAFLFLRGFPFPVGSSDLYRIALLNKTFFFMAGSICA